MRIDVTKLVAPRGTAPMHGQSAAPRAMYFKAPVKNSAELERVLALPRRALEMDGTPRAEALIDMITARYSRGNMQCRCAQINPERHAAEGCITRLRLLQALALRELGIVGGLLGPIGTGHGKTLIDLLAPFAFSEHAAANMMPSGENILCVLLTKPDLLVQLVQDYDYVGEHFYMPSMVIQGAPHLDRPQPGMPKLQVMPYSRICRPEATAWLNVVKPHALIADECHKLRNLRTATTARVDRFMDDHPITRMCAMSGSMTSKSMKDYDHLANWCLRRGSPLPTDREVTEDWCRAIDPQKTQADPGPLLRGLIATGCCGPGDTLYRGIRRRIAETLGVVSSTQSSVDCELELTEREAPKVPAHVHELIKDALAFQRPDGEELVTAMQAVDCACTLACGFHYKWIYPTHKFPDDEQLILDWFAARKAWHKEQRAKLNNPEEHLDSPQLLEYAAQRALGLRPPHKGLPEWHSKTYRTWYNIKDKVRHDSKPVRVDPYLALDAVKWGLEHRGVIWYQHSAFGEWVHELSHGQLPIYGGGKDAKLALLGDPTRGIKGEDGSRSVILSLKAHGTGTNGLQFIFADQLYGTNPADPAAWEQSLARLHRPGQRAKQVRAQFYMHTPELRKHVKEALRAALYIEGTMGSTQKLRVGFPLELERKWNLDSDDD